MPQQDTNYKAWVLIPCSYTIGAMLPTGLMLFSRRLAKTRSGLFCRKPLSNDLQQYTVPLSLTQMLQNFSAFSFSYWSEEEYDELFSDHVRFPPVAAFQSSHLPVVTIPRQSSHLVPLSVAPAEPSHLSAVTLPIIPPGAFLASIDRI